MTFKHKLSKRLALMRAPLAVVTALAACNLQDRRVTGPSLPSNPVVQVVTSPDTVTLDPYQTRQFLAYGRTQSGDSVAVAVRWTASGGTITSGGLYTADTIPGNYQVTATTASQVMAAAPSMPLTGSSGVKNRGPLTQVIVSPATASVVVGGTLQFMSYGRRKNGDSVAVSVTYAASGGSISAAGLYTAGQSAGTYRVLATQSGGTLADTAAVTIATVPVASVAVSPASASVTVGQTVQLTATPKDAGGNALSGRVVMWATSNGATATVSASGVVTGVAAGSAMITATSEGKGGTATVTVTSVPVASVAVSPASASVTVGQTVQLTATPKDASGNPLSGRAVTWATSNGAIATVSASGVVTGVAAGSATITATSEGKSGSATVIVSSGTGTSVTLVGAGDIAECGDATDDSTAALLGRIGGTVFTAGDNAYPDGYYQDYVNCWGPSWGQYQAVVHPAAGNHEYHDIFTSGAADYYRYFYRDHGTFVGDSGSYYYSYDLGAWHIVVLNTVIDMSAGSPQEQWLRADLAASTKRCTLAYMHYPRFSSGADHGSDSEVQPLWQALYDYGAEIAIAGHDHEYERFAPQTPDGRLDTQRGIRSFVVGTGGGGLYSFATPLANSEVRNSNTWGVLKLTLRDGDYDWAFVPITGQTFTDAGSGSCH